METALEKAESVTNPIHRLLIHEHRRIQDYAFENDRAIQRIEEQLCWPKLVELVAELEEGVVEALREGGPRVNDLIAARVLLRLREWQDLRAEKIGL